MVKIAVCDDEKAIAAELEHTLIAILGSHGVAYEIDLLYSADALCRKLDDGAHYDLIFLDIQFARNEINGVEAGRLIREAHHNNAASIVFISWEQKYAMQLFEIRPMSFLIKPLTYGKIEQTVKTYLKITNYGAGTFAYQKGHDTLKVRIKDIRYLENHERKIILHRADGTKDDFYGSLKEAYNSQLKNFDFLFIHASYLVNFDYITALKYNQLHISSSESPLPISSNRRNEVKEHYVTIMERRRLL